MRAMLGLAFVMAVSPATAAGLWTAACSDEKQVQYQQIVGGEGYLHADRGDGKFETIKLKQSYFDGKTICGKVAVKTAPNEIAAVCADNEHQVIRVATGSDLAKGLVPEKAATYCPAIVSAN